VSHLRGIAGVRFERVLYPEAVIAFDIIARALFIRKQTIRILFLYVNPTIFEKIILKIRAELNFQYGMKKHKYAYGAAGRDWQRIHLFLRQCTVFC